MTDAQITEIAAGLGDYTHAVLIECNPDHVVAPIADLLNLCLSDLAVAGECNHVRLTPLGQSVAAYLKERRGR